DDFTLPPDPARRSREFCREAIVVEVPGVGHWSLQEETPMPTGTWPSPSSARAGWPRRSTTTVKRRVSIRAWPPRWDPDGVCTPVAKIERVALVLPCPAAMPTVSGELHRPPESVALLAQRT